MIREILVSIALASLFTLMADAKWVRAPHRTMLWILYFASCMIAAHTQDIAAWVLS